MRRAGDSHSSSLKSGGTFNCQRQRRQAAWFRQRALLRGEGDGSGHRPLPGQGRVAAGGPRSLRVATFCSRPSSHVVLLRAKSNRGLGGALMRQSVRLCRSCVTEPSRHVWGLQQRSGRILGDYARRLMCRSLSDRGSIPRISTELQRGTSCAGRGSAPCARAVPPAVVLAGSSLCPPRASKPEGDLRLPNSSTG